MKEGIMLKNLLRTPHFWLCIVGVFLIATGVAVVLITSSPARQHVAVPPPAGIDQYPAMNQPVSDLELPLVELEGVWQFKQNDVAFVARVEGQHIAIDMVGADGTSIAYWDGSFKTAESPGHAVTSVRSDEVALSQDTSKDFRVNEGSLVFPFKAMGVTKNIELTR
jgi:hypothetical protein